MNKSFRTVFTYILIVALMIPALAPYAHAQFNTGSGPVIEPEGSRFSDPVYTPPPPSTNTSSVNTGVTTGTSGSTNTVDLSGANTAGSNGFGDFSNNDPAGSAATANLPENASNAIQSCQALGAGLGGIAGNILQGVLGSFASGGFSSGGGGGDTIIDWETEFITASTLGNSNGWLNPENAFASDNSYASASTFLASQDYDGFDFMLPSGAFITGIEVLMEASASTASGAISIELSGNNTDTITTTNRTTGALSTNDRVFTFGGPNDDWGRDWGVNQLSPQNFRVRLLARPASNTVRIDLLQVKVYYQTTDSSDGGFGGGGNGSGLGSLGGDLLNSAGQQAITGLLQGKSLDQVVKGIAGNILGGPAGASGGASLKNLFNSSPISSPVNTSRVPVFNESGDNLLRNEVYQSLTAILREEVTQTHKECVLDPATAKVREMVLKTMTGSVLQWATAGFEDGPAFPQNLARYRFDVYTYNTSQAINSFSEGIDPRFRGYAERYAATQLLRTPAQRLKQTNSGACDAYYSGTWRDGDLERCYVEQINNPEATTPIGAALGLAEAANEYGSAIVSAKDAELSFGDGFFSDVDDVTCPAGAALVSGVCQVVTPGSVIRDQVSEAVSTPRRQVEQADEISELISSLFSQLLGRVLGGSGGLLGLGRSSGGQASYLGQLTSTQSLTEGFREFQNVSVPSSNTPTTAPPTNTNLVENTLLAAIFYAYPERIHSGVSLLQTLTTSINPQAIDSTREGGLGLLTDVARGKENEHRLLYRETNGTPSWTHLGEGGQLSNISWNDISNAIQSNAQNVTLAYTIPRKESCELAPPSISDLATVAHARTNLIGAGTSIDFIGVDSKGWWSFDAPALWTNNLFNATTKGLATNLASISTFENALSNVPPATDVRAYYKETFDNAITGAYGTEAQTLAKQISGNLHTNPIAALAEAEEDLVTTPCTLTVQRQTLADSFAAQAQSTGVFMERTNK